MIEFKKRSILKVLLLSIVTFGIYGLVWVVETKGELNKAGGDIPTAWCLVFPVINLYFWYRYTQAYLTIVKKREDDSLEFIMYFLISAFVPFVSMILLQDGFNRYQN